MFSLLVVDICDAFDFPGSLNTIHKIGEHLVNGSLYRHGKGQELSLPSLLCSYGSSK